MRRLGALLVALATAVSLGACAGDGSVREGPRPSREAVPSTPLAEPTDRVVATEGAALVATFLTRTLGDDRRFGAVAAGPDGSSLFLDWHGDAPIEAIEAARTAHPDITVTVRPLSVSPGALRDIQSDLVSSGDYPGVGAAYIKSDWSAIVVLVHDSVPDLEALATELTSKVGFPVEVQPGAPVPAAG